MVAGLETFNSLGTNLLTVTDYTGIVLGTTTYNNTSGYLDVPGFALGTPFWTVLVQGTAGGGSVYADTWFSPVVTVTSPGGVWRINWTWYSSGSANNPPGTIVYGVY